jgi:hypothetical protein
MDVATLLYGAGFYALIIWGLGKVLFPVRP